MVSIRLTLKLPSGSQIQQVFIRNDRRLYDNDCDGTCRDLFCTPLEWVYLYLGSR